MSADRLGFGVQIHMQVVQIHAQREELAQTDF